MKLINYQKKHQENNLLPIRKFNNPNTNTNQKFNKRIKKYPFLKKKQGFLIKTIKFLMDYNFFLNGLQ